MINDIHSKFLAISAASPIITNIPAPKIRPIPYIPIPYIVAWNRFIVRFNAGAVSVIL